MKSPSKCTLSIALSHAVARPSLLTATLGILTLMAPAVHAAQVNNPSDGLAPAGRVATTMFYSETATAMASVNAKTETTTPATPQVDRTSQRASKKTQKNKKGKVTNLHDVLVSASSFGPQTAINDKRFAPNVLDELSTEQIRALPDTNVADAIKRLPGISVQREEGRARYVAIRGVKPQLNNVTLNGNTILTPDIYGRAGRSAALDIFSAADVGSLQVVKSVKPDMSANAIGGTVNIITPSAFDHEDNYLRVHAEGGRNSLTKGAFGHNIYSGNVIWSNRYGANGQWGVLLSANYSKNHYLYNEVEAKWNRINGYMVPTQIQIHRYERQYRRTGADLNIEYRPNDKTNLYFRALDSQYKDNRVSDPQVRITTKGHPINQTPTSGDFTRGGARVYEYKRLNYREVYNLSLGGKTSFGDHLSGDFDFTYAHALENIPLNHYHVLRFQSSNDIPVHYDTSTYIPTFDTGGVRLDPGQFNFKRYRNDAKVSPEELYSPRADLTWTDTFWGSPGYIKAGLKYDNRKGSVDAHSDRFVLADNANPINMGQPGFFVSGPSSYPYYPYGPIPAYGAVTNYLKKNPQLLKYQTGSSMENSIEDSYVLDEKIWSGYLMGNIDFDSLNVLAGVRVEHTKDDISSMQIQSFNGGAASIVPVSGNNSYTDVLPNVQLRYNATDDLILRLALTETIGRPNFPDEAPISSFNAELIDPNDPAQGYTGSLSIGNPDLQPRKAKNADLTGEYYFPDGGIFSVGIFYKHIDNPIFQQTITYDNYTYQQLFFPRLGVHTTVNGRIGLLRGATVNFQRYFTSLPGALSGLGLNANFTYISSTASVSGRSDKLPLFGQPSHLGNVSLLYDKYGIHGAVAWNYRGRYLSSVGGNRYQDRYIDNHSELDFQLGYDINEHVNIFVSWKNISNQADKEYQFQSSYLREFQKFGSTVSAGVNVQL